MPQASLDEWHQTSATAVAAFKDAQTTLRELRVSIDHDFPEWVVLRQRSPADFLRHDARREVFVTAGVVLRNAQLAAHFISEHLSNLDWWEENGAPGATDEARLGIVHEFAVSVTLNGILGLAIATEELCRSVGRPQTAPFRFTARTSFFAAYTELCNGLNLRRHKKLLDVLRLIRNTIHTNGAYSNRRFPRVQRRVDGRPFHFRHGQSLTWATLDLPAWLGQRLAMFYDELVRAPRIAVLPACPRQP